MATNTLLFYGLWVVMGGGLLAGVFTLDATPFERVLFGSAGAVLTVAGSGLVWIHAPGWKALTGEPPALCMDRRALWIVDPASYRRPQPVPLDAVERVYLGPWLNEWASALAAGRISFSRTQLTSFPPRELNLLVVLGRPVALREARGRKYWYLVGGVSTDAPRRRHTSALWGTVEDVLQAAEAFRIAGVSFELVSEARRRPRLPPDPEDADPS